MATRATYEINGTTFYCHWDGYPEGAATRFLNMLDAMTRPETGMRKTIQAIEDRRGGEAFAFIRGNLDAEPIANHDAMGGTEWRYTVTTNHTGEATIKVESDDLSDYWTLRFHGELSAWLDSMEGSRGKAVAVTLDRHIQAYHFWKIAKCWTYATRDNAEAIAAAHERLASSYGPSNPNGEHHAAEARAWREALAIHAETTA
jgi:hypothetical protein